MTKILSTDAIVNRVRIKLGMTPAADSTGYGRFWLKTDGTHVTRLPSGADWTAAVDTHTHSSELPSYGIGEANKFLQVNPTGTGLEWDTASSGVTDHGALTGLLDDDHPQYHNDTRGDARYYTQTQLNAGQLDTRYYTESEVNALLHNPVTVTDSSEIDFTLTVQDITAVLKTTTVVAGTYPGADITVDSKGRITAAATGANNHVPVTVTDSSEIDFTLTGQNITAGLKTTGVTAGTYNFSTITVDANGRTTSASTGYLERSIVQVTSSKTLALSDRATKQECNSASTITITVPTNASVAFPVGTEIDFVRYGAGAVTLSPSGGVTIRSAGGALSITEQYRAVHIYKRATDEWVAIGAV